MDWKTGTFYPVITVGVFNAGGTPNGLQGEIYGGTTAIHGIPPYGKEDLTDYLEGNNIDAAISIGGDSAAKISGTAGLSVDLTSDAHLVYTGNGLLGYQYTIEKSIEYGGNAVPNGIDVSVEGGGSSSWMIREPYQISWWPW
jgi:hypothetical protein